ncbi:MAG: DUF1294 domain-containing protein [Faecousia sp.]
MGKVVLIYLLTVNAAAFLMMLLDKRFAVHGQWRIPEKTLFLLAVLGGSLGGCLAMRLFHHKTRHRSFAVGFPLLLVVQAVALILLIRFGYLQWT